jgi:hypothetical protein
MQPNLGNVIVLPTNVTSPTLGQYSGDEVKEHARKIEASSTGSALLSRSASPEKAAGGVT